MRFYATIPLVFLVVLSGCVGDQHQSQAPVLSNPTGPVINLPTVKLLAADDVRGVVGAEVDRATGALGTQLHQDTLASSNNTQQQLSGLVTTQISKLAESIKGVEANVNATINTEIKPQLTANATAIAHVETSIATNVTATNTLSSKIDASFTATANLQNTMQAQVTATIQSNADMKIALGHLSAQVQAMGTAVAGVGNKVDQTSNANTAGHDVNYFPKEVVEIMLSEQKSSTRFLLAFIGAAQAILLVVMRNARARARDDAQNERYERQRTFDLLTEALTHVAPEKQADLQAKMASKGLTPPPPDKSGGFKNLI